MRVKSLLEDLGFGNVWNQFDQISIISTYGKSAADDVENLYSKLWKLSLN